MAQIVYTSPGAMIFPIDVYDPGTDPDATPTLVFSQLYSLVEGLWSSTQARKLAQQVVAEVTHRITTRFVPDPLNPLLCGIKSRMFVMFRGRKFTIDKVIDPDERQVEIWLLCIERDDGIS